MKISSISDIPEALFYNLKEWTELSITNWNIFIGIPMILIPLSIIGTFYFLKVIGKPDERTNKYYKEWAYVVLIVVVIGDVIFPKTYLVMQFFSYKYALAFFVGTIYLGIQYKKDFS